MCEYVCEFVRVSNGCCPESLAAFMIGLGERVVEDWISRALLCRISREIQLYQQEIKIALRKKRGNSKMIWLF